MPNKRNHLNIIKENFSALQLLSQSREEYTDWCVTIIFYMALHYIHAYLAGKGEHPTSYEILEKLIEENRNLKRIYDKYYQLKDDSIQARYFGKKLKIYPIRNSVLVWFIDIQKIICELLNINPLIDNIHSLFPLHL